MHTNRRGVFLSLYPTTGQGQSFFIRRGMEFLSLYPTKGKGLYLIVTPLGIRGDLLLACLLLNRHDQNKPLYGHLFLLQRHGVVGDSILGLPWQISNCDGPDTPIL